MIGSKLIAIQVPFLFKYAIDALSEPMTAVAVAPATLLLLYGATRAGAEAVGQLRNAIFARVTEGALRRMARRTFTHLHALELGFHLSRQTGALTRVVERGTRALGVLLSTSVLQVLPLAFEVTAVSTLLAVKCGPAFSLATLATLGGYAAFTFAVTSARTKVRKAQNAADMEASQRFTDSMLNYETVKYFDATEHEARRYDAALVKYESAAITTQLTLAGLNFGQSAIFSAGLGVSMMLAAQECAAGRMSVGDVVMVQGLVFQLTVPLQILGTVYTQVRQAATDMQNLRALQLQTPQIASAPEAPPLELPRGGHVVFDNVVFSYSSRPDDPPLLKGLSFEVQAGETVAIVGTSGSGKSSILRLLYRFYDPSSGTITIDGQVRSLSILLLMASDCTTTIDGDVRISPRSRLSLHRISAGALHLLSFSSPSPSFLLSFSSPSPLLPISIIYRAGLDVMLRSRSDRPLISLRPWPISLRQDVRTVELDSLRRRLGVVPQDVVLFNDTIAYNLRYGRLDATQEEVEQAAKHAQVHDAIVRMPQGYETLVGERGLKLSGGEKQRIAIGRALLRDAPILLCDEATSAVDTVTESSIFGELRALSRRPGRRQTCIMIAHRLSTVVDADRILVVRDGAVVESGTHAELLGLSGEYATLWSMQYGEEGELPVLCPDPEAHS